MQSPLSRVPEKHRRKVVIGLIAAAGLLAFFIYLLSASSGEADVPPTPVPTPTPLEAIVVPDTYLYQHFLSELGDCYEQTGQPVSPAELERTIGRDWEIAVQALMTQYRDGTCVEAAEYLHIPGRALWMADQLTQP